jgi:MFS family permease
MKKNWIFVTCFISSTFGGLVSTLMSVYLPVAVKDLVGPMSDAHLNEVSATINSVFIFGWMFGGVAWGLICDRTGRVKTVLLSTLCFGFFTFLTGACATWWQVVGCRFLSGFGVGGVLVTTTMLVSESWTGKRRAVALGILSISIPVGIFSAGLINVLLPNWRQAFLIGAIPAALAGITGRLGLLGNEQWQKPDKPASLRPDFLAGPYRKNLLTGSVIFGAMLIGMWAIFSWLPTWVDSVVGSAGSGQGGVSMMLMGAGGLSGGFVSGWVAHAIGLKRTMVICFAVCFILSFFLFRLEHQFTAVAGIEIAVMAVFFGISQGALSVYIPDLFPPAVGAAATGFCFNVGRLFTATAVFFVGALVGWLGGYGNTLFIFSFIFLIGLLATSLAGKK